MTASTLLTVVRSAVPYHDGYPPLERLVVIGDGTRAAPVARDGAVRWLYLRPFDLTRLTRLTRRRR